MILLFSNLKKIVFIAMKLIAYTVLKNILFFLLILKNISCLKFEFLENTVPNHLIIIVNHTK